MKSNKIKEKLAKGETVFGCSVMIPSPQVVEMIGAMGFDWVLIDCEHGTITIEAVELMTMAADACGITAIARPRSNTPFEITQLMDRGVAGVQIPYINTAEQAREAVAAVKFGPESSRGMTTGTRSSGYGMVGSHKEFVEVNNRESLVSVQIETQQAIENIDEILKVDGIDVFFIGPMDLAQSMGHASNPTAPEVMSAIASALHKIVSAGRLPGLPASKDGLKTSLKYGVRYVHAQLPQILRSGADEYLRAGRLDS